KLEKYLFDDLNAIFLGGTRTENYVYGCYFAANSDTSRVDAVFNSMHFERITVSDEYIGTPQVACETLKEEIEETQKAIDQLEEDTRSLMESHASELM